MNGGAVAVVEVFGVAGVNSGTLQILDSSAFTNFICELVGSLVHNLSNTSDIDHC
jgi:hypothetical protein